MSEGSNTPSGPTWRDIMQVDAPAVTDPCTEFTTKHLFGQIWARPGLGRRDRRLITLTVAAVSAQRDSLTAHEAWPEVKPVLRRALEIRRQIAREGWWN